MLSQKYVGETARVSQFVAEGRPDTDRYNLFPADREACAGVPQPTCSEILNEQEKHECTIKVITFAIFKSWEKLSARERTDQNDVTGAARAEGGDDCRVDPEGSGQVDRDQGFNSVNLGLAR